MQRKTKPYQKKRRRRNLLPLFIVMGGVILLASVIFFTLRSSEPETPLEVTGAPSLKLDKDVEDLGDVPLGQTVEVSFRLTNVGDQELRFTSPPYIEVVEGC